MAEYVREPRYSDVKARAAQMLPSSLREVRLEETRTRAAAFAACVGVTRVTDITRLDRVGIPVYVSVRPSARTGSLCVNAGKGICSDEAYAGACMEAIEYAVAEPGASATRMLWRRARDVLDGPSRPDAILDLCPLLFTQIPLDAALPCVYADELVAGGAALVPAELVYLPAPRETISCRYFGGGSIGLAAGNSVDEATVYGIAEVIEHDVRSFHLAHDQSSLVDRASLPLSAQALADKIAAAGLTLYVRYIPNEFDLPFLMATIVDHSDGSPFFVNAGYGCHFSREAATIRAICEAAQSRLSFIHGGRDDLADWHRYAAEQWHGRLDCYRASLIHTISNAANLVDYSVLPDHTCGVQTIGEAFDLYVSALDRLGLKRIYRIVLTEQNDPVQVVRIIVPGLEAFDSKDPRVGMRLRDYVQAHSRSAR